MQLDTSTNLTDLPRELIIDIILFLDEPIELVWLRGVCRLLKDIIDGTSILQLRIELAMNALSIGTINATKQDIPTIHRRLLSLKDAWRNFKWTSSDTFKIVRGQYMAECVTSGGVMCLMPRRDPGEPITIQIRQFPRPVPPKEVWTREWVHNDLEVDFCVVSVSQDLAVVFEKKPQLHLRTISSNQTHPLAAHPIIRFHEEVDQAWKIKIFEDRIVLWFRDETRTQGRLWFCNWRTGEITKCPGHPGLDSFTVISRSIVMTSSIQDPRKPLLRLFPSNGGLSLDLELPRPAEGYQYGRIFVSDSLPSSASNYPEGTKILEPEFLSTGQLDVILVHIKMLGGIKEEAESPELFNVFISRKRLIHIYEKHRLHSREMESLSIPWNEWGPDASRWIPKLWLYPTDWALHGSRYVSYAWSWTKFITQIKGKICSPSRGDNNEDAAIALLDFNPYLVHNGPNTNDHLFIVHHGEYNESPDVFDEPLGNMMFRIAMLPMGKFCQAQFDTRNGNLLMFDADQVTVYSFYAPLDT